ncbi:hypothetical protein [Enterovibrio norvegicus]|uniref:hypothetical protein n=1 Tax=Enterovibrio norvegicus TaxID=188144 RepID=UPI00352F59D1
MLTIITPFSCQNKNSYLYERMKKFIDTSFISEDIKRIIVDFNSNPLISKKLKDRAAISGIEYIELERYGELFSIGKCRNQGAKLAKSEYIMFQDVDLFSSVSIYESILDRLREREYFNDVELIPCLYLTKEFCQEFDEVDNSSFEAKIKKAYLENDSSIIEMYAPSSSCLLINRKFYLCSGGVSEEFIGHGYEDFDLHIRLCEQANKFYRTHDFGSDEYSYDSLEYRGYRPYLSMFGRQLMNDGIYFCHHWHPKSVGSDYQKRNKINKEIFSRRISEYKKSIFNCKPLVDLSAENSILLVDKSKDYKEISQLIPFLGNCEVQELGNFTDENDFIDYVKCKKIKTVYSYLKTSDWGAGLRTNDAIIYHIRESSLSNALVIDGDLNPHESLTFNSHEWSYEIDESKRFEIGDYIFSVLEEIKKPISIPNENNNHIYVGDINTKSLSFESILDFIEVRYPSISTVYINQAFEFDADYSFKIKTLDASDLTLMLTAEVIINNNDKENLIALMANKLVVTTEDKYYSVTGLSENLLNFINNDEYVIAGFDASVRDSLFYYLVNSVCSFYEHSIVDGDKKKILKNINIPQKINVKLSWRNKPYPVNSRYYDFFRHYFESKRAIKK